MPASRYGFCRRQQITAIGTKAELLGAAILANWQGNANLNVLFESVDTQALVQCENECLVHLLFSLLTSDCQFALSSFC